MKPGEKIHATIIQMKEQVKEIIISILVGILQHVIGELSCRIQTLLQPEVECLKSE